jgi:rod shape-determining protein MreD
MHLLPAILLGYLAVGVQVGLNGFVHPNVVLIVAVFLALFTPRETARVACFVLGLMQDLLTQQTLGLFAVSYGIIGIVIGNSQAMVFRERPLTHVTATAIGSLITWSILIVHGWIFGPPPSIGGAFSSSLLSVIVAPLLIRGLMYLRPMIGIRVARRF